MRHLIVHHTSIDRLSGKAPRLRRRPSADTWAFVYIFFTNGIPFDSPNRSEPCPTH